MAAKRSTKKTSARKQSRAPAAGRQTPAKNKANAKKKAAKQGPKKAPTKKVGGKKVGGKKAAGRHELSAAADRVTLVQEIIDVMEARGAVEVEFKDGDFKLRVRRREEHPPTAWAHAMPMAAPMAPAPMAAPAHHAAAAAGEAAAADDPDGLPPGTEIFASPMVGTFYRAAQPDAEPFVKEGDRVGDDHVLCIIEAMKVMNEIKSERSFEVVKVLAENGEPVEFGQPLFAIKA